MSGAGPGPSLGGGGGGRVRNADRNGRGHGDALCFMVKTWARHKTTNSMLNNGWRLVAVGGWWSLGAVLNKKMWGFSRTALRGALTSEDVQATDGNGLSATHYPLSHGSGPRGRGALSFEEGGIHNGRALVY